MRKIKIIIIVLIYFILTGTTIWNKIQFNKCIKRYKNLKIQNTFNKNITKKIKNALIKSQFASSKHLGKTLFIENLMRFFPTNETVVHNNSENSPKLILAFSELSCNVCQDSETQFAIKLADTFGTQSVSAIIYVESKRYLRNYIRFNRVHFPVYYCKDNKFFNKNNIKNTPMIFLVDKNNKIINSYCPIPGLEFFAEPFHEFCMTYFFEYNTQKQ
jgi:hypothetical protein